MILETALLRKAVYPKLSQYKLLSKQGSLIIEISILILCEAYKVGWDFVISPDQQQWQRHFLLLTKRFPDIFLIQID